MLDMKRFGRGRRVAIAAALLLALAGVLGGPRPAHAESDGEVEDFAELDLSALLNEVVTPGARKQKLRDSAAIISVLTAQEISDLGAESLAEAISYLPGVNVVETYFGYASVHIRGQQQAHYNNKSLMLIDGVPYFETVNGSFHLELVPIDVVERIELIRGPGSIIYGTNAFAGVINIITKSGDGATESIGKTELVARAGSFQTQRQGIARCCQYAGVRCCEERQHRCDKDEIVSNVAQGYPRGISHGCQAAAECCRIQCSCHDNDHQDIQDRNHGY